MTAIGTARTGAFIALASLAACTPAPEPRRLAAETAPKAFADTLQFCAAPGSTTPAEAFAEAGWREAINPDMANWAEFVARERATSRPETYRRFAADDAYGSVVITGIRDEGGVPLRFCTLMASEAAFAPVIETLVPILIADRVEESTISGRNRQTWRAPVALPGIIEIEAELLPAGSVASRQDGFAGTRFEILSPYSPEPEPNLIQRIMQ